MNLSLWIKRFYFFGLTSRKIVVLVLLPLAATVSEIFGIGIFLPIFQFIRLEGDINALVAESSIWQYVVDAFSFLNIEPSLALLLLLAFTLFLGRQILNFIRLIYTGAVTQYLIQIQRNRLFDRYIEADTSYHDRTPVGNLSNIVVQEVNGAVSGIMGPLELITYIIMLVGYLIVLSILSWEMTLFSVITLVFSSLVPKAWINKSVLVGRELVNANTLVSGFLIGRLRSPRLVRLSGTESAEKEEFHRLTLVQRKHNVEGLILKSKTDSLIEPIVIGLSLAFLYFAYTVLHLQIEIIGLYLVVLMRLMPVAKSILMKLQSIKSSLGSIEALEGRFKAMKDSLEQDNGDEILSQINQPILIENVSYCYPDSEKDVLKNINIEFEMNKMTAIVGPSGSGKSTLIDLLPSLRLPTDGIIKINGKGIEKYRLKSLRQLMSYTPQSPQIFDGTVKHHILYGKSDATDNEIQDAVRLAGADEFINQLPQGIDTKLGEDAIRLSGGQRQRLDLARALVRKAAILILDEPTSNLDAESEDAFNRALSKIRQETNTTIIVIAHRLASISKADNIVVLNKGMVESKGLHAKLLKEEGWYSRAWKMQSISSDNIN